MQDFICSTYVKLKSKPYLTINKGVGVFLDPWKWQNAFDTQVTIPR